MSIEVLAEAIKKNNPEKNDNLPEINRQIQLLSKIIPELSDKTKDDLKEIVEQHITDPILLKEIFYDLQIDFHDQNLLNKKILKYLSSELEKAKKMNPLDLRDIENREWAIKALTNKEGECEGLCTGLSTIWSYGKRIEDIRVESLKKQSSLLEEKNPEEDNILFFNKTKKLLALWDEKREFTDEEKKEIERLISNSILYQSQTFLIFPEAKTADQLELEVALENTKGERPINCFDHVIICSKAMLKKRLEEIIKPKSMIFMGCSKDLNHHMMSPYQNLSDGKIYFFDSNSKKGESFVKNIDELSEKFWKSSDPEKFIPGFSGFDPVDWHLRMITFKVFRFSEDPEYKYPTNQAFKIANKEFIELFDSAAFVLSARVFVDERIKKMIESLSEDQVIELLKHYSGENDQGVRNALVWVSVLKIDDKSPALARYIKKNNANSLSILSDKKHLQEEDLKNLKFVAEKPILELTEKTKEVLNINDVLEMLVLPENIGKTELAIKLLDSVKGKEILLEEVKYSGFILDVIIAANLKAGNIETAKLILGKLGKDFKLMPSMQAIFDWDSEEIAQFMYDNFKNHDGYNDKFGSSQLQYMPIQISYRKNVRVKDELMKQTLDLFINGQKETKIDHISLIKNILAIKSYLSLEDVLLILAAIPGELKLATELLEVCENTSKGKFSNLVSAIHSNLEKGNFDVVKTIVNIVGKRFQLGLSAKQIEDLGNVEFAKFMFENYDSFYQNEFGQSELLFVLFIIESKLEKEKIIKEINVLLLSGEKIDKKMISGLTDRVVKFGKFLDLSDVLDVLSLNSGDEKLAKLLLEACINKHRKDNDSYLDASKFSQAIRVNINNKTPENAKLIIEIVGTEFDVVSFFENSEKSFGEDINKYFNDLISKNKEEKVKLDFSKQIDTEKIKVKDFLEKEEREQINADLRDIRIARELFDSAIKFNSSTWKRSLDWMNDSAWSAISRMKKIDREGFPQSLKEASMRLSEQYDYILDLLENKRKEIKDELEESKLLHVKTLSSMKNNTVSGEVESEIFESKLEVDKGMLELEQNAKDSINAIEKLIADVKNTYKSEASKIDAQFKDFEDKKRKISEAIEKTMLQLKECEQKIKVAHDYALSSLKELMGSLAKNDNDNIREFLIHDNVMKFLASFYAIVNEGNKKILNETSKALMLKEEMFHQIYVIKDGNSNLIYEPDLMELFVSFSNMYSKFSDFSEDSMQEIFTFEKLEKDKFKEIMERVAKERERQDHDWSERKLLESKKEFQKKLEQEEREYEIRRKELDEKFRPKHSDGEEKQDDKIFSPYRELKSNSSKPGHLDEKNVKQIPKEGPK